MPKRSRAESERFAQTRRERKRRKDKSRGATSRLRLQGPGEREKTQKADSVLPEVLRDFWGKR